MARKTLKENVHEFTQQINSSRRTGTIFSGMKNHDEKKAKTDNQLCCKDCRHFRNGCDAFIGVYHQTCSEFEWW